MMDQLLLQELSFRKSKDFMIHKYRFLKLIYNKIA
jgi:hypothetical protein